jgi:hypothetical protein
MPALSLFPSPMVVTKIKLELGRVANQTIPYFEIRGCSAEGKLLVMLVRYVF